MRAHRQSTCRILLAPFLLASTFMLPSLKALAAEPITVIVNRDNPIESISRQDLADFYEKKKRQWPDGTPVRFIDRPTGSPERQELVSEVLRQSESDIDLYWIGRKLYTGDSAPLQVPSDAMVIQLVKTLKGAIGYLFVHAPLKDAEIKSVKRLGLGKD